MGAKSKDYYLRHKEARDSQINRHNKTPAGRYSTLLNRAAAANLEVELTLEQYTDLISSGECHYCGGRLQRTGYGIDRKDSSLGYTLANSVACCKYCNHAKGSEFTYEEFMTHIAPGFRAVWASRRNAA